MGRLKEYPPNAIISIGTCTGKDTFEIVCEVTDEFLSNFALYEAEIYDNKITKIKLYEQV